MTDSDDKIIKEARETAEIVLQDSLDESDKWEKQKSKDAKTTVFKKIIEKNPVHRFKALTIIENTTPLEIRNLLYDIKKRLKWDKETKSIEVLKCYDEETKTELCHTITNKVYKGLISSRNFFDVRSFIPFENGIIVNSGKSVSAPKKKIKGVLGNNFPSGFVMIPIYEEKENKEKEKENDIKIEKQDDNQENKEKENKEKEKEKEEEKQKENDIKIEKKDDNQEKENEKENKNQTQINEKKIIATKVCYIVQSDIKGYISYGLVNRAVPSVLVDGLNNLRNFLSKEKEETQNSKK
ncbi:hypothetical protein M0811_05892 [Anaeramoeba ignava]|uniref:START domain-containing protein n=1 Tax=Anaeramoeba ignava TaxID=1746090 RepID=A0A9Q0LT20_ANAIG|nr:hypothetical protein M0811_05892 [Anaeramoeba ignava]